MQLMITTVVIYRSDMTYKCYEYYTKDGIQVTPWFEWMSSIREKWQLKGKLKNFYKEV